jgi:ACS family D-galactonate transporter-like MFS transporter
MSEHTRPTRARLVVLALIAIATMINYLDRTVLGIAAPLFSQQFGIDARTLGFILSAFGWTYALAQIPGGALLDRIGVKLMYYWSLTLWSAFTALQGLATGVWSMLLCRLGLGVAEAPCYPANSRVLNAWFPQGERARANATYSVGQYVGLGLLSPVLYWITAEFGWRTLLVGVGACGILFGFVWWRFYSEPDAGRANAAELAYIRAGGGLASGSSSAGFSWQRVGFLLSRRQILGASIGQFCGNSTLVFFVTWFPSYLAGELKMGWLQAGFFAMLPFIAASVGVLFGGALSDFLLRRTGSANIARKLPVIAGLGLAATSVLATVVGSNGMVILVLSIAFFGQGMVNLGWTLISDVAPRQLIGLTGGLFNFFANVASIVTPIVIGYTVAASGGSFRLALTFISALAVIGVLIYVFVIGDVKRVEYDGR